MTTSAQTTIRLDHELRFTTLVARHGDCCVPCDPAGHVDIDCLSERMRNAYFYARTLIGREFAMPRVQACAC